MIAHYIIFHPEREQIDAHVKILRNNLIYEGTRPIFVDKLKNGSGNEDPFVFSDPWIYSYCHAPHLYRVPNKLYVQPNSILIFVEGTKADKGFLKIDTIFIVGNVLVWPEKAKVPPTEYSERNYIWERHIKHGIRPLKDGGHKGEYTYVAMMYKKSEDKFSFLPLFTESDNGISLESLTKVLRLKIRRKLYGKFPLRITKNEAEQILNLIDEKSPEKVIKII